MHPVSVCSYLFLIYPGYPGKLPDPVQGTQFRFYTERSKNAFTRQRYTFTNHFTK